MLPRRTVLAAVVASAAAATPAHAFFYGTATDPAGDTTDGAARDIVSTGIAYDPRQGRLQGMVTLGAVADESTSSFVQIFAGRRGATGDCDVYPAMGFGGYTDEAGVRWALLRAPGPPALDGRAVRTGWGETVQVFDVTDAALKGATVNCFVAALQEPGNSAVVYDETGPLPLAGQPELAMSLQALPRNAKPGQRRRFTIALANPGHAPTGPVKLSVARVRGATVSAPRTAPSLAPGSRRRVTVTVTFGSRASGGLPLRVNARAGRLAVESRSSLYVLPPRRPLPPPGPDRSPQLCNRYQPDLSGQTGGTLVLVPC